MGMRQLLSHFAGPLLVTLIPPVLVGLYMAYLFFRYDHRGRQPNNKQVTGNKS